MKTLSRRTLPKWMRPAPHLALTVHLTRRQAKPRHHSDLPLTRKFRIRHAVNYFLAVALAASLCTPVLAQEIWQAVDDKKALLKFDKAKRYLLQQRKDGEKTLEQSEWALDDGSIIVFHVTRMGPRWVLVKGGPDLEKIFRGAFPNAELVEIGEPFVNKERGTQGDAQWIRYREHGAHCVFLRQYGWDDASEVLSGVPLGNRVAIGYRCGAAMLTNPEIQELFARIDF